MVRISLATAAQRETIYRLRHEVYARELGQHSQNERGEIHDILDEGNVYLVATVDDAVTGFISLTSPRQGRYSIDKYLQRDRLPIALDDRTWEVRILTVVREHRGTSMAILLMYAAFRWVEAHGGSCIVALGRREIHGLYMQAGLQPLGVTVRSGAVEFVLMSERIDALRRRAERLERLLARLERTTQWDLIVPFRRPAECFHGGAFFDAIGDEFDQLERRRSIINADVLDAWFPPSPRVIAALDEHLPWLLRTSPPLGAEGLVRTIARVRGVDPKCVLPGAGSSDLIYLALREWLRPSSRALILEPMYGEYAHVLEKVIGCRVDRLGLARRDRYDLEPSRLLAPGYDIIVIVNPNSPTGRHVPREDLEPVIRRISDNTLVWIDETYVDYVDSRQSLERFAVTRENVVVCKSMSKVYALSGARCAYLCAAPHLLERLRSIAPPWSVSLPAQVAAVAALRDEPYYAARYRETTALREELMSALPFDVVPGVANFLLCHLSDARALVARCREQGLFIRDASTMGASLGDSAVRIAVKDRDTNARMLEILYAVAGSSSPAGSVSGTAMARWRLATST